MVEQPTTHRPQAAAGPLRTGPASELIGAAYELELSYAPALYEGMSLADIAHVIMLMETGIAPWSSGQELLAALLEAHNIPVQEFPFDPAWGDVYTNRERYINQQVPSVGGWLGAGRARREVTNIGFHLAVRWRLLLLLSALQHLARTVVDRAEEHVTTLMPDYTYLQQAQPTTLGHYLLGFAYPMLRDCDRLRACFGRINLSPGGIGSVNGSRLPLDRHRVAQLLGFDGVVHHTRDAMWQADIPIEITSTAIALLVNLDRLAEDLQVWVTQEFNLVELADDYARASVIMPQKKNPYSLTYVRGLANTSIGQMVAMANVGRTPSGQPDNRTFAYETVPRLLDQSIQAVRLMEGVLCTLNVNAEVMAQRVSLGYTQATDLADAIMTATGLPYQSAHLVVGQLVATAVEAGIPAQEISPEMIDMAARAVTGRPLDLPAETLAQVLNPHAIVATRTGLGGAAREPMYAMFAECHGRLAELETWRANTEHRLTGIEEDLISQAQRLVNHPKEKHRPFGVTGRVHETVEESPTPRQAR
jgi:argininosuccinate lyase